METETVPVAEEAEEPRPARGPFQMLPPLTTEEVAQLEASIRAHGVEEPIWVDDDGKTLDGHHRRAIADRLGIAYETRVAAGLSEAEKGIFAIRKNTERRQLNRAQRALVALRAEPYFREQAKARQGARTDLWPELAKGEQAERRRVWAAEEAARVVGLPLSSYKRYRAWIVEARKGRGTEEVERAIDGGLWNVKELSIAARDEKARYEAALRVEAERKARQDAAEKAAQAWKDRTVLGHPRERYAEVRDEVLGIGDDGDGFWRCHACDVYWPPTETACGHCGTPRPAETDAATATAVPVSALPIIDFDPFPATAQEPSDTGVGDASGDAVYEYVRAVSKLAPRDAEKLRDLESRFFRYTFTLPPHELAVVVVTEWHPRRVSELRQSVRTFLGWLSAMDSALTAVTAGTAEAAGTVDGSTLVVSS